ncbi:MEDS domain-containing protein [Nocardia sp. NPDC005978]|uniref:MEDS domain-containing protein n=1 Tax=Nocardia sp. NPDC005978 TaxID=3156725 RepID=UPI0033B96B6A
MRRSSVIQQAQGMGIHDHACWAFDEPGEFRLRASEFLGEGLRLGCRVWYIASGDAGALAGDLESLPGWNEALRTGGAQVVSIEDVYEPGAPVIGDEQVRTYAAATEAAIAAGFSGLRVAADTTPLVRTPAQLAAFVRYEYLADRLMAAQPFSAMCAYDRGAVGAAAVMRLASVHPNTNVHTQFRIFGATAHAVAIVGEVDGSCGELFGAGLAGIEPDPENGCVRVDATRLSFLDHNGLLRLAAYAESRDAELVVQTAWPGVARLAELLELPNVRVEDGV